MEIKKKKSTEEKYKAKYNFIKETQKGNDTASLSILNLDEVGSRIMMKDLTAIKQWLNNNNIQMHKFSKVIYVYEIEVNCKIDIVYAKKMKVSNPANWKELYKIVSKDETVYKMVVFELEGEIYYNATTKVRRKSKSDEKLYKDLL